LVDRAEEQEEQEKRLRKILREELEGRTADKEKEV